MDIKRAIERERLMAIQRMIEKNFSRETILDLDYTKDEYDRAVIWNKGLKKASEKGYTGKDAEKYADDYVVQYRSGQKLLYGTVLRLRNGETPEQIEASGIDQETIFLAQTIQSS